MAFADEIKKASSERVTYVRLEPSRYIQDDLGFTASGNKYAMAWPYRPTHIEGKYNTFTESLTTTSTDDEWYYNDKIGVLYINIPNYATDELVMTYTVNCTTGTSERLPHDLDDDLSPEVKWEPIIKGVPRLTESMSDAINGIMSISSSPLNLINLDRRFNKLLTNKDSWYNTKVTMWMSVNNEKQKVFTGVTGNPAMNDGIFYVPVKSNISKLKSTLTMGDPIESCVVTQGEPLYFGANNSYHSKDIGKAVDFIYGSNSFSLVSGKLTTVGFNKREVYQVSTEAREAICIDYAENSSTSNRTWVAGRGKQSLFQPSVTGLTSTSILVSGGETFVQGYRATYDTDGSILDTHTNPVYKFNCTSHTLRVGDSFDAEGVFDALVDPYAHFLVVDVIDSTSFMALLANENLHGNFTPTENLVPILYNYFFYPSLKVSMSNGGTEKPLCQGLDYYALESTTSAGNKVYRISFATIYPSDRIEELGIDTLSPDEVSLYCSIHLENTNSTHAEVVEDILIGAGLPVDTASMTQANTELTSNIAAQFPIEGNSPPSSLDALSAITSSTLGYVTSTETGDMKYGLFNTPSTFDYEVGDRDILEKTMKVSIDSTDVVPNIQWINQNNTGNPNTDTISHSTSDPLASRVYKIEKSEALNHSLAEYNNARLDSISAIRTSRRVKYQFRTSTKFLTSSIGDKIKLVHDDVLDESGEVLLVVTKVSKSESSVTIEAMDFQTIG